MSHVVLLGNSIFDNGRYVPGGPAVIEHLRKGLPTGWRATLLARDGAVAADVVRQMDRLPADATHLVVSAGGNDALDHSSFLLHEPPGSFAEGARAIGRSTRLVNNFPAETSPKRLFLPVKGIEQAAGTLRW